MTAAPCGLSRMLTLRLDSAFLGLDAAELADAQSTFRGSAVIGNKLKARRLS
jgi:hypothetical protein